MSLATTSETARPAAPAAEPAGGASRKLSLLPLIGLVVGSTVGGGAFSLPGDMSAHAAPGAILIGWTITGLGMLMLAFVYQGLAVRKPGLDSGPYAYARAGFGPFVGFQSAWGYWLSGWVGNVSNAVSIFAALGWFFPVFGAGNTVEAIVGASVVLWAVHVLVLRGVRQAAVVNALVTAAKALPLIAFVLIALVAFNWRTFTLDFWGARSPELGDITRQVSSTMIVTLWVFMGIEGASVFSAYAAKRSDVGRATVLGFLGALAIYVLVSMLSTGILTQKELAGLPVPSLAGVLERTVGPWGAALASLGLVIAVGGAFLAWTLLTAEIPRAAAADGTFPHWFARRNAAGTPVNALWLSSALIQIFLVVALFRGSTYQIIYGIASVAILPPYVFSGAYALKLALSGETYEGDPAGRWRDVLVGALATAYGVWLCFAARVEVLLPAMILFAPATLIYVIARREQRLRLFSPVEAGLAVVVTLVALYAIWWRFMA